MCVDFAGYHIPKDTVIAANLYYVNNSKDIYGDPQHFRPERFLDEKNEIKKCEAFIPFALLVSTPPLNTTEPPFKGLFLRDC